MGYALRRLGLVLALVAAFAPILAMKWWAFAVTIPALGAAFLVDPDMDGRELE
jgi:hypothetical protein